MNIPEEYQFKPKGETWFPGQMRVVENHLKTIFHPAVKIYNTSPGWATTKLENSTMESILLKAQRIPILDCKHPIGAVDQKLRESDRTTAIQQLFYCKKCQSYLEPTWKVVK